MDRTAVSDDGLKYAWIEYQQPQTVHENHVVHVTDLRTGTDRILVTTGFYEAPDWREDGIYVVFHKAGTDADTGLWRIDPTSGTVTPVIAPSSNTPSGYNWRVGASAAWSGDLDPNDPSPYQAKFSADRLRRFDLKTNETSIWFYRPGKQVGVVAFTIDDRPIVQVLSDSTAEFWLATGADSGRLLYRGSTNVPNFYPGVADDQGVWGVDTHGLYLLTPDRGIVQMASGNYVTATVAGRCR